jgi:hypothetical protein
MCNGAGSPRAGQWFWIRGERRFVPTTNAFMVKIDGVTFRSPPARLRTITTSTRPARKVVDVALDDANAEAARFSARANSAR